MKDLPQHTPEPEFVKYVVGLKLAQAGIRTFGEAARKIPAGLNALSMVLHGVRRTPRIQKAVAEMCRATPEELFGKLTHPTLVHIKKAS